MSAALTPVCIPLMAIADLNYEGKLSTFFLTLKLLDFK